ncbi:MAG: DnaJ domain-containing protein [Myxococcota bacterium]
MAASVFLRDKVGAPIGPVPFVALEVLFSVRVVDESTPISTDGAEFQPLAARPELIARLSAMRERVLAGQNPWPEGLVVGPFKGDLDLATNSPFSVLFKTAASNARGVLWFEVQSTQVQVHFLDGKVVRLETTAESLSLGAWLLEKKLVTMPALERAVLKSIELGGDLGAALIATQAIPPHLFLEHFANWSKWVLERVMGMSEGRAVFAVEELPPPPIPLGWDRFGALLEAARKRLGREELERAISGRGERAVIPSQVEGVTLEDLKLLPKELRVLKGIDGARNLSAILEAQTTAEQRVSAMFAVYVALETGFAVLGDDPEEPRERQEAERLEAVHEEWKKRGHLEILGIRAESSDEEVRSRYMELAKVYHPDRVRTNALPRLIEVRRALFTLVQAAYEATENAEKRAQIQGLAKMGYSGKIDEQAVIRSVLESETYFKKAEALGRMKKWADAVEHINEAIKRKADEPEFRVHRAYYAYMAAPTEPGLSKAVDEIAALAKKNPTLGACQLFLARLHKQLRQPEVAMKHFKKLLEIDPRNHEAESELRLFAMRQDKGQKKKWF